MIDSIFIFAIECLKLTFSLGLIMICTLLVLSTVMFVYKGVRKLNGKD